MLNSEVATENGNNALSEYEIAAEWDDKTHNQERG
jgi:hypothetical protein